MNTTENAERYHCKFYVDKTINVSPETLASTYLARFRDLVDDEEVFADIKTPEGKRKHFHVISEGGHLGPAKIRTPHHFHMSFIEVPPGSGANLHAHDAPEIFVPISGRFAIIYGDKGEHQVELEPLDTISVPVNLMRTFKNIGNVTGILMVIYDGPGEVLGKIYVNQETADDLYSSSPEFARSLGLPDREV